MQTLFSHKMTVFLAATLTLVASVMVAAGETIQVMVAGEQVAEIMPGMLEGYLSKEEQLDSKEFVLPAPHDSARHHAVSECSLGGASGLGAHQQLGSVSSRN